MSNEQNDSNDELHGDPRILDQYSHSANTVGNERVPSSASHDIIEESVRFTSLSSDETPSAGETEHVLSSDTSTTINPVGENLRV